MTGWIIGCKTDPQDEIATLVALRDGVELIDLLVTIMVGFAT